MKLNKSHEINKLIILQKNKHVDKNEQSLPGVGFAVEFSSHDIFEELTPGYSKIQNMSEF